MENPWSSPWTADDPAEAASEPAGPSLAFPPASRFDLAGSSSPWADDNVFGDWGDGDSRGAGEDIAGLKGKEADTDDDGIPGSVGLDAEYVEPMPSSSADADPWAAVVSPVNVDTLQNMAPSDEDALEQDVLGGSGFADRPDDMTAAPLSLREHPGSPTHAGGMVTSERASISPEPISPEISTLGVSADAVAPVVLSHRDVQSRPEGTRQVSKVRELVDMYDDIAKKVSERPEQAPSRKPPRASPPSLDESGEDVEDWEEFEVGDQNPSDGGASTPASPVSTPAPPKLLDAAEFQIDEAAITTLFDTLAEPAAAAEIPDHLDPLEDFTVAERRAWYRLSRQGSARLHDAGDTDNYARVTWHGSAVSADTFSIVRRWMQEGAALGGPARAGVRGSAATFGWEQTSSSDPVDLSFLKRPSVKGHPGGGPASTSSPAAGAAASVDAGSANARPFSTSALPVGLSTALDAPPRSKPAKPSPLVFSTRREDSDSDEEWGEMVSSPQVTGSFGTTPDCRADSAVSFGKSSSGSSLDKKPIGTGTPRSKADGHETKPKGHRVRVVSSTSLGSAATAAGARPTQDRVATAESGVQIEAGEAETAAAVIAHLPDLSYMLR